MSEREIRKILRDVCADLERHSRQVVRDGVRKIVLPTVLGAGLAMTGCDARENVPVYGVPADAGIEAGRDMMYGAPDAPPKGDGKVEPVEAGAPDMMYAVADAVWPSDTASQPLDLPPPPPYMAPDALPQSPDAGAQPPYMAPPFPDGPPAPPYMAPDATALNPDAGSWPLYAPPFPDEDDNE